MLSKETQIMKKTAKDQEKKLRDSSAEDYEHWYKASKGILFDLREKNLFREHIRSAQADKILEIGSGTGRITEVIAPFVRSGVAFDFSNPSLRILQEKNLENITIMELDATTVFPFGNDVFDIVSSCQVVQHMYLEDVLNVFSETYRVLKPGGTFIMSVYNFHYILYKEVFEIINSEGLYFKRFSPGYIRYLAQSVGFSTRKIKYYKSILVPFKIFNWLPSTLGEGVLNFDRFICASPIVNRYVSNYIWCCFEKK
jgi:SAM-dependent methyltransferase